MNLGISNKIYQSQIGKIQAESTKEAPANTSAPIQNPIKQQSFTATSAPVSLRTSLTTNEEKQKYSVILSNLDKQGKKNFEVLLKNGKLLNTNSNDKSSTLDNLYNILANKRAEGLDPKVVLKETIATIANPFVITQQFGDIPKQYVKKSIEAGRESNAKINSKSTDATKNLPDSSINEQTIDVQHSGSCVAASIEFNLAYQTPAEFARFASELSSQKVSVTKNIETKNLANNALDAVWLLNAFEVPYESSNFNSAKLTLAPDKSALLRAQIQNSNKDGLERSLVDVLMQSTFMNVGSQQAYNSMTDVRKGKFNQNDRGLIEFEKTFTESVVMDKNKVSVTYQVVDENAKLIGYEADANTVKKHILDSLAIGENVIIGYTLTDNENTIINGHEITIVGARQEKNGKLTFICNDTDDNNPKPIEYSEDYIIPKIHHAGLPQQVVEKDVKFVDNWVEGINAYKKSKDEPLSPPVAQAA